MGYKINGDSPDYRTAGESDNGSETGAPHCPKRDEIVEQITGGFADAVYVAGWNDEGGFISAIAETDSEREIAAGILNGAEAGLAVFVSGPAAMSRRFTVSANTPKKEAEKALFESAYDDTFDRLGGVDMPRAPAPTMMDTECRAVTAAFQSIQKAMQPKNPLAAMFGGG